MNLSWYEIALRELGIHEIKGAQHNARVLEYHASTLLRASTDEVPWCSSFVNWCLQSAGYTGTKSAAASSWFYGGWGRRIASPVMGCIAVVERVDTRKPNGRGHHVAFYAGRVDGGRVRLLGGNQRDSVCYTTVGPERIIGYVIPAHMDDDDQGLYDLMTKGVA